MILQRTMTHLENSRTPFCRFKSKQFKPVIANWRKYLQEEPDSGLSSRNQLYLHSHEIYSALSESFAGTDNQLKFNLSITKKKLGEIHGADEINKLLTMDTDNEEIHRRKVLALTGWNCKHIPAVEG